MSPLQSLKHSFEWKWYFGKRYLRVTDFIKLCEAVGLHGCTEGELEEYERERWMFPAARMVMPEEYAQAFWMSWRNSTTEFEFDEKFLPFYQLDWAIRYPVQTPNNRKSQDLRHPIDRAWGKVEGLERPNDKEYVPWESYEVILKDGESEIRESTVSHFYHYWQIYELYQIRKSNKGIYRDNVLMPLSKRLKHDDLRGLSRFLDAVSYFQHSYQLQLQQMLAGLAPDDDGWIALDQTQQNQLEQAAHQYAIATLRAYRLDEDASYEGLRGIMYLHNNYDKAERVRLAEALKADIWRTVEFIHYAFSTPDEKIAERAGQVGGYAQNYLELLFPNRRKEARNKAVRILQNLAEEHNRRTLNYSMPDNEIDVLLDYVESIDLAWFEYILVELNEAYFARHSWQTAETFLHLKTLASFPESLMKTLILRNGDAATKNDFNNQTNPGMGTLVCLVFRDITPSILAQRDSANHWNAKDTTEFANNLSHLIQLISSAPTEEAYLGCTLALATLVRNFTSHLVVEDPQLFQSGQYVRCVRAILTAAFSAWRVARIKGWI